MLGSSASHRASGDTGGNPPHRDPAGTRTLPALLAVLALTALGAALRFPVADFGLPHFVHYDEYFSLVALDAMREDPANARGSLYYHVYPHLITWLVCKIAPAAVAVVPGDLQHHLEAASRDLWILRSISAALSLLAVPGTWALARRFFDRRTALLAAAFMATSLFHVWYSVQAKPHGPGSGAALLAVIAALEVRRRGTPVSYVVAGLAAGLAIGISQASVSVLPALAVAHFLRNRSGSRFALGWLAVAAALIAVCVRNVGEPGLDAAVGVGRVFLFEEQRFSPFAILGIVLHGLWHFDPLYSALALASLLAWPIVRLRARGARDVSQATYGGRFFWRWLRGREDLAVVLSHVLLYAAVLAVNQQASQRYFLLLWPYAMCIAAWGTIGASAWFARRFRAPRWSTAVASLLPIAIVAVELALALRMNAVQVAPDTSLRAAEWIERALDPQSARIAVLPGFDLPLLRERGVLPGDSYEAMKLTPWARYQARLAPADRGAPNWKIVTALFASRENLDALRSDARSYLEKIGADYAVFQLDDRKIMSEVTNRIRSSCTRVARFSPMEVDEGDDSPLLWWDAYNEYQEGFSRLRRMLHAQSLGGVIEIYRVDGLDPAVPPAQERRF